MKSSGPSYFGRSDSIVVTKAMRFQPLVKTTGGSGSTTADSCRYRRFQTIVFACSTSHVLLCSTSVSNVVATAMAIDEASSRWQAALSSTCSPDCFTVSVIAVTALFSVSLPAST